MQKAKWKGAGEREACTGARRDKSVEGRMRRSGANAKQLHIFDALEDFSEIFKGRTKMRCVPWEWTQI